MEMTSVTGICVSSTEIGAWWMEDNGSKLGLVEKTPGRTEIHVRFNGVTITQPSLHVPFAEGKMKIRNQLGILSSPMKVD